MRKFGIIVGFLAAMFVGAVHARDLGQWEGNDPSIRQWFRSLMQPDNPHLSCCGEADGYWCDDYYARDGKAYCKITDNRDDEPLRRPHVPVGTEIEIPNHKLKWDRSNPTGHAVVFLAARGGPMVIEQSRTVLCFVQNGGV